MMMVKMLMKMMMVVGEGRRREKGVPFVMFMMIIKILRVIIMINQHRVREMIYFVWRF